MITMKTNRLYYSICGDYDLMKGWVPSYHELRCIKCTIKKLIKSSSSRAFFLLKPKS
jgi:hypothetical protein